jgi:hypothetical protein
MNYRSELKVIPIELYQDVSHLWLYSEPKIVLSAKLFLGLIKMTEEAIAIQYRLYFRSSKGRSAIFEMHSPSCFKQNKRI